MACHPHASLQALVPHLPLQLLLLQLLVPCVHKQLHLALHWCCRLSNQRLLAAVHPYCEGLLNLSN